LSVCVWVPVPKFRHCAPVPKTLRASFWGTQKGQPLGGEFDVSFGANRGWENIQTFHLKKNNFSLSVFH
jgi:hypothetical protein